MKTLLKLSAVVPALVWITVNVSAQSLDPFSPYAPISPSVESWSMSHYGGLSPAANTGAMSTCIPVYCYSDPDFNIPVELCYQFDGYRPSENSGTVGYGWHLNCGGVITREVRGLPDEDAVVPNNEIGVLYGYYYTAQDGITSEISDDLSLHQGYSILANTFYKYALFKEEVRNINPFAHIPIYSQVTLVNGVMTNISTKRYDMSPDIFHFNFLGISGDFMLMPDGHVEVFNSNVPYGNVSVEFNVSAGIRHNQDTYISGFTITMSDGTRYKFGGTLPSIEYGASYNSENRRSFLMNMLASAWKLTEITTAEGRRVDFSYSDDKQIYRNLYASYSPCSTELHSPSIKSTQHSYACASVLQSISVDGKRVLEFTYEEKSKDEGAPAYFINSAEGIISGTVISESKPLRLSVINAVNSTGHVVDQARLNQVYASSGTPKMFLESVSLMKNGKYRFEYNTADVTFPKNDTEGTDFWGWWNCETGFDPRDSNKLDPTQDRYHQVKRSYKDPNLSRTLAGAMTGITYPTGGSTVVEYEANEVEYGLEEEGRVVAVPFAAGGVRVCRITDKASAADQGETRSFSYQDGFLYRMPRFGFVVNLTFFFPDEERPLYGPACALSSVRYVLTAYANDCDYIVSRDNILDYRTIKITNPDGSYSVSEYANYDDEADEYPETMMCYQYTKRGSVSLDDAYDAPTGNYGPYIVSPITDRKSMRRQLLSETFFNPSGTRVKKKQYWYSAHRIQLDCVFYNNVDSFIRMPWACESPLNISDTETEYYNDGSSLTVTHRRTYNDKGQLTSETEETVTGIITLKYKYNEKDANLWGYDKQLSDAIKTSTVDGVSFITAMEHYDYLSEGRKGLRPTAIKSYVIDTPVQIGENMGVSDIIQLMSSFTTRETSFRYDSKGHPLRVDFPGGSYIEYSWSSDGKYISGKTFNADENSLRYEWKDMVGLSKIWDAAGRSETYIYDTSNRLRQRIDTNGNPTEEYHYHIINE